MSVINQVLKDLEKRRNQRTQAEKLPLSPFKPIRRSPKRFLQSSQSLVILVSSTAAVFIIGASYLIYTKHTRPIPKASEILAMVEPSKSTDTPATPSEANIQAINYNQENHQVTIELQLNRPEWYRLSYDLPNNRYRLSLENTALNELCGKENSLDHCIKHFLPETELGFNVSVVKTNAASNETELDFNLPGDSSLLASNFDTEKNKVMLSFGATDKVPTENEKLGDNDLSVKRASSLHNSSLPIEAEYSQAWELIQDQRLSQGLSKLEMILNKKPDYKIARQSLAALLIQLGRYQDASQVIHEGKRLHLGDTTFIEMEARMLLAQNRTQEAEALLSATRPPIEKNLDYYAMLAAVYQKQKKIDQAAALYEKLVSLRPDQSNWWLGLGMAREALGDKNATLEAYQQALAYQQLSPDVAGFVQNKISALGG